MPLFRKYEGAGDYVYIDAERLPSTSPVNCAVFLEKLVEAYRVVSSIK